MKLQYKIKKIMFITEEDETIEIKLTENSPYFLDFNLIEKSKKERDTCSFCEYNKVHVDDYPCNDCTHGKIDCLNLHFKRRI